jgi:hypothetical protein
MEKTMDITFRHTLPANCVSEKISQCQTRQGLFHTGCQAGGGGGEKNSPNADPTIKTSIDIRSVLLEIRSGQRQKDTYYLPLRHAKQVADACQKIDTAHLLKEYN